MSSSFSPLERSIARVLSRLPFVKRIAKRCYAILTFLMKRKSYSIKLHDGVQFMQSTPAGGFFGYYDKSPVNSKSNFIIYQKVSSATSIKPRNVNEVTVCLNCFPADTAVFQFNSKAFNWQQGTKLQWINDTQFIFNDLDTTNNSYVARIVDSEQGKVVRTLDKPIYDCHLDKFALTLNFERLAVYSPDYGYFAKEVSESDLLADNLDGIFYINLRTGQYKIQLSLDVITAFEPQPDFALAKHTVNHLMISPDGKRFMFIHRWFVNGRRFDRLILSYINSNKLEMVASNEMVSHCFWLGSDKILGYLRGPNGQDSYWIINCSNMDYTRFEALDAYGDGHPHLHGNWMITDTYPDKARMQKLIAVNLKNKQTKLLGEFFHGFDFDGETRCDLHPRFSFDGKYVFFDSVYSGARQLCWAEFSL